jgi:hypothetical protein
MSTNHNSTEGPLVIAPRLIAPLSIGDLDNPDWQGAPSINITRYWSGATAPIERHTEVRICWDEEALSVRFVCSQHEPLIISSNPVTDKKTLGLWDRDVCEIFVAPDAMKPERYFEFEAAPTGEWVDLGILMTPSGRETDWDYHSGMSAVARVQPDRVIVGMSIPWSESIPKPERREEWRINLFRCVGPGLERYLAWQPTRTSQPNFHVPEAFGWLRFT